MGAVGAEGVWARLFLLLKHLGGGVDGVGGGVAWGREGGGAAGAEGAWAHIGRTLEAF